MRLFSKSNVNKCNDVDNLLDNDNATVLKYELYRYVVEKS